MAVSVYRRQLLSLQAASRMNAFRREPLSHDQCRSRDRTTCMDLSAAGIDVSTWDVCQQSVVMTVIDPSPQMLCLPSRLAEHTSQSIVPSASHSVLLRMLRQPHPPAAICNSHKTRSDCLNTGSVKGTVAHRWQITITQ